MNGNGHCLGEKEAEWGSILSTDSGAGSYFGIPHTLRGKLLDPFLYPSLLTHKMGILAVMTA